ncbi:MAG: hypothetical protein WCK84_04075 [Bacteroidota bacterium]
MKRFSITTAALLSFVVLSGYAQLFPKVDKPTSPGMSMLVLQFARDENGKMSRIVNMNFTGWAPAVKGPDGNIVPFRNLDGAADFTNIYYAENLIAGDYALIGFYHIYTDFSKLNAYEKEKARPVIPSFAPYKDMPYHVKQLIPLKEAVNVALVADKVMTFGNYAVKYKWVGGSAGTTDDRWKVIEEETSITLADSKSDTVLRYIKTWATPAWKLWNAKNPVN